DGSRSWNEGGAALDVEQPAVPGVSQSAGYHAVPIADLRAPQHVKDRLSADDGTGIKGVATQTHVAGFAFKAEHEGRVDRLPVAAERAAANETAAQVGVPRVSRYEPRRDSAAFMSNLLTGDRGPAARREVAGKMIAVAVKIHHRVGDLSRAVPSIEIEHLAVLAAAVLAISPESEQDIGLLAAQVIFE